MIGKTVSHYKIIEKLGGGGMGVVYKAQDTKLDRTVALKFLPQYLLADKESEQRFISEAKAASSFDHPNICTIYDINKTEDDQFYIVMGYYTGETLKKKLDAGPLQIDTAINYAAEIATGLARAHEAGIIHRDIKPANIMITDRDEVKILDFGLAKTSGEASITKMDSTVGTVSYMSPEQTKGDNVDHRTDIWSLGVVLYEMLTGELPFKGDYEQAIIYSILNEEPQLITGFRRGVPLEFERIVNKALMKNEEERYQNIAHISVDLKNIKKEDETGTTPSKTAAATSRPKKIVKMYIGILFLLILSVSLYFLFWPKTMEHIDSIAVLPLDNLSDDPKQEYFVDGMTESLISELAKIEELRVISRTSIMRYKHTNKSLPEIAKELNVHAILEGSVLILNDQIRITAQLINGSTDEHIWVEQYDRDLKDVFPLFSEVAKDIAQQIKVSLTPDDEQRLTGTRQVNPEAYRLYIEGMKYRYMEGEKNYHQAASFFTKAIELDPEFALAYARLTLCYAVLKGIYGSPGDEIVIKARETVTRAIELNDKLSEAYVALGLLQVLIEKNWVEAEKSFRYAIQLNPGSIEPHIELGHLLTRYGSNLDEAFVEYRLASELDPLSVRAASAASGAYFQISEFDTVIELCKRRLEIEPKQRIVRAMLGWTYIFKGNPQKGLIEFEKLLASERDVITLGGIGFAYGILGIEEKAKEVLLKIKNEWPDSQWLQALIEATLGNWELYLDFLEQRWQKNQRRSFCPLGSSFFDPVRLNPRFSAMTKEMGIDHISKEN